MQRVAAVAGARGAGLRRPGVRPRRGAPGLRRPGRRGGRLRRRDVRRAARAAPGGVGGADGPEARRASTRLWPAHAGRRTSTGLRAERAALYRTVAAFFERFDLLLTPTIAVLPFPVGRVPSRPHRRAAVDRRGYGWIPFTYPFNLTGHPAISVPAGWTDDGLPVGLQIVGPRHGDAVGPARRSGVRGGAPVGRPLAPGLNAGAARGSGSLAPANGGPMAVDGSGAGRGARWPGASAVTAPPATAASRTAVPRRGPVGPDRRPPLGAALWRDRRRPAGPSITAEDRTGGGRSEAGPASSRALHGPPAPRPPVAASAARAVGHPPVTRIGRPRALRRLRSKRRRVPRGACLRRGVRGRRRAPLRAGRAAAGGRPSPCPTPGRGRRRRSRGSAGSASGRRRARGCRGRPVGSPP